MAAPRIPGLVLKHGRYWYWQPSAKLRRLGFRDLRLDDDPAIARQQAIAQNERARAETMKRAGPNPGTLAHALTLYQSSDEFTELAESSKTRYRQCIEILRQNLGDADLDAITPPVAQALKKKLKRTPATANYVLRILRIVYFFARREGLWSGALNPAEKFRRYEEAGRDQVWSRADEAAFQAVCGPELWAAYMLAVYTAQRQADILRWPRQDYDGAVLRLRQNKTGTALEIAVAQPLKLLLDALPTQPGPILRRPDGQPWKGDHFRHEWRQASLRAGLGHLQFLDLRRTAIVRLAEAGCTIPEVVAISGHTLEYAGTILQRYLPRTLEQAKAAILKLERHRG